ncbi:MAG: methyltransferase domain-containing protein [Pseudomonadota bacterium]
MPAETPPLRPMLFQADLVPARRDRAERLGFANGGDFLHREVAALVAERLEEVTRPFSNALIVGSGGGVHAGAIAKRVNGPVRQLELGPLRAARAGAEVYDSADALPIEPASQDLCVSALELHGLNDPVGHLIQLRRALRPDGLMIAALFCGQTMAELRTVLMEAEASTVGGISPRIAPMGEIRDLGALLQRAGFAMPVADVQTVPVTYASMTDLMRDLRAMGEANTLADRRRVFTRKQTLRLADDLYRQGFADASGRLKATFEICFLTGWAPSENQPKPRAPGSAQARLADALGTDEVGAGDAASPGSRQKPN